MQDNWEGALWLLGEHLLDFDTGATLFDNPERLHHDLLEPAAMEYLDTLHFSSRRGGGCPVMKQRRETTEKQKK